MRTLSASLLLVILTIGCARQTPTQPDPVTATPIQSTGSSAGPLSGPSTQAKASEQVIFSGVAGTNSSFPGQSPAGFWIWCEAESSNPYAGECNGSIYFYALRLTKHVEGEIVETSEGIYEMTVSSTLDSSIVDCVLKNTEEAVSGPRNTVEIRCATPSGAATSTNAVVNVTGPEK